MPSSHSATMVTALSTVLRVLLAYHPLSRSAPGPPGPRSANAIPEALWVVGRGGQPGTTRPQRKTRIAQLRPDRVDQRSTANRHQKAPKVFLSTFCFGSAWRPNNLGRGFLKEPVGVRKKEMAPALGPLFDLKVSACIKSSRSHQIKPQQFLQCRRF